MMHELQPGDPQLIGPYRLRGRLGTGGMGQVFLGRSAGGRPVAVKVVRAHLATDPEFRERFRREIAVARKVSGVYTSPVIDADVDGPMPWLATAYVEGPSLADAVSQHGPLPPRSVLALAAGLAEGLNAIHAAGVVHRDLKPANVLLAEDGPRVIDFGISRAAEASALTHTGLVVGSPGYMSPEQAEGREAGPPSDIFSLGAVLAFAATGEGPFGIGSTPALVYRVVYNPPNLDHLPMEIRPLVERCLAKDPAQRPTAAQLLAEAGAVHPATDWLPEPVTRTFIQAQRVDTEPGLSRPGAAATQLDPAAARTVADGPGVRPYASPTMTAAVLPPPGGPGRAGPRRRPQRRLWRPVAIATITMGLVAGCTFTGVALTSSSGHPSGTQSGQPTTSPSTFAPVTATPSTSAPATTPPSTSTPSTSAPVTVTPSTSPTVIASPSPSVTPTVTASPSASPTATVTTVAPTNTPTAITTTSAPATPAPVTTTAAP